jgi:hypothetical protein
MIIKLTDKQHKNLALLLIKLRYNYSPLTKEEIIAFDEIVNSLNGSFLKDKFSDTDNHESPNNRSIVS